MIQRREVDHVQNAVALEMVIFVQIAISELLEPAILRIGTIDVFAKIFHMEQYNDT